MRYFPHYRIFINKLTLFIPKVLNHGVFMKKIHTTTHRVTTINLPQSTYQKLKELRSEITNHTGYSKAIHRSVTLLHGLVTPGAPDYNPHIAKRYAGMTVELGKRRRRKN